MRCSNQASEDDVNLVRQLVIDALTPQQLDALAEGLAEVQRRIIERKL